MKEFFLLSNRKKINILEDEKINVFKSIVVNIHGLGSHFQYKYDCENNFEKRIKFFRICNIKTFGIELSGHGKSDGTKGVVFNYYDLLIDINNLIKYIKNKYSNIPIYLIGESLGGALSIKYSILYPNTVSGIILLAPLCDLNRQIKPRKIFLNILKKLSYINSNIKLPNFKIKEGCLSKDFNKHKTKNKYYVKNVFLASARECHQLTTWIQQNSKKFNIPILIFHAKDDLITDYLSTKLFFENIVSNDKELVTIDNAHHLLLVPICRYDIFPSVILYKIINWINKKQKL